MGWGAGCWMQSYTTRFSTDSGQAALASSCSCMAAFSAGSGCSTASGPAGGLQLQGCICAGLHQRATSYQCSVSCYSPHHQCIALHYMTNLPAATAPTYVSDHMTGLPAAATRVCDTQQRCLFACPGAAVCTRGTFHITRLRLQHASLLSCTTTRSASLKPAVWVDNDAASIGAVGKGGANSSWNPVPLRARKVGIWLSSQGRTSQPWM